MNFGQIITQLSEGFLLTVLLFVITLVLAIPLGLLISLFSMSSFAPLKYLTKGFIWIIRGTPLMLQIIVVSFVPSVVFDIPNKDIAGFFGTTMANVNFLFCVVAFVINYAAYFAEIFRGGIESVSKGQYEAGQVLGMSRGQTFRYIVLPQVVKRVVPPMSNEIITLVKDTSLARIIGVVEIIKTAQNIVNLEVNIMPLFYSGAFYLVFNGILTILLGLLEKKFNYYKL
ncbi:MAG: amino acid ABC transporter permease [Christensenellales bacterium]